MASSTSATTTTNNKQIIVQRREQEASTLITELSRLAASTSSKNKSDRSSPLLPKLSHWYRIGTVLSQWNPSSQQQHHQEQPLVMLQESYQQLISSLPGSYLEHCFANLQKALQVLTVKATTKNTDPASSTSELLSLSEGVQSLVGLLSHSTRACQLAYSQDLLASLSSIYDHCLKLESSASSSFSSSATKFTKESSLSFQTLLETSKHVSLQCLSYLLLDGLILTFNDPNRNNDNSDKQQQQPLEQQFMQALQTIEEQSTECIGDLLAWQETWESQQPQGRHQRTGLEMALRSCYYKTGGDDVNVENDATQLDYALQMLETARRDHMMRKQQKPGSINGRAASSSSSHRPVAVDKPKKPVSAADELDRRIGQVQNVLPDLGAGYIETALSHYQGNVETTVSMLFGDVTLLPPALQVIDRQLPRRKKANSGKSEDEELAAEAKQIVKDRMALELQQEEDRYRALMYVAKQEEDGEGEQQQHEDAPMTLHGEYDDDYDDQYDDMADGGLGGADSGWYDTEGGADTTTHFEKMKLYNQVTRQEEAEGAFWEENRNTNRSGGKNNNNNNKNDTSAETGNNKYRGPDKIKGGRVIGPDGKVVKNNRGGKKQQQQKANAAAAASQQQGKKGNTSSNNNNNNATASSTGGPQPPKKPKTKPKSDNRVNRQRDKKQQKQGTFGANS